MLSKHKDSDNKSICKLQKCINIHIDKENTNIKKKRKTTLTIDYQVRRITDRGFKKYKIANNKSLMS